MSHEPQGRLLIVDDDRDFAGDLELLLSSRFAITTAPDAATAVELARSVSPDVVLLDLDLGPGADGFSVLEELAREDCPPSTIVLTGDREVDTVVRAVHLGAFHYVCKPPVLDELVNLIGRGLEASRMRRIIVAQKDELARLQDHGDFVAGDPATIHLLRTIDERIAPGDVTVLITGESGTGKEVVAKRIHALSHRARGPFVGVNCAALTATLIESELMGHERGAFTGADSRRRGKFEQAAGGTILLDEIGHSPLEFQAKLLRVLEDRTFVRVGGEVEMKADVRVLAATSRDPQADIDAGKLLPELYFRLNTFELHLPPLRERRGDILPLARHFLAQIAAEHGRKVVGFTSAAEQALCESDWPGNVRELRNTIERAVLVGRGPRLNQSDLLGGVLGGASPDGRLLPYDEAKDRAMERFKVRYLSRLLHVHEGHVTRAAEAAGLKRQSLQRMIRECGIDPEDFKPAPAGD